MTRVHLAYILRKTILLVATEIQTKGTLLVVGFWITPRTALILQTSVFAIGGFSFPMMNVVYL